MNKLLIITLLSYLLGTSVVVGKQLSYQLKLHLSEQSYYLGDELNVAVQVVNISDRLISLPNTLEPQDYWLKLTLQYEGSTCRVPCDHGHRAMLCTKQEKFFKKC